MIVQAIGRLVEGASLTQDEAAAVMLDIMEGRATPAQFGAYVTALRLKGDGRGDRRDGAGDAPESPTGAH